MSGDAGLMTAAQAARAISGALLEGDEIWAFKMVLQARDHLRARFQTRTEAGRAFEDTPPSTGSPEWDTLLAAVVGHEFEVHDRPAPSWTVKPALDEDWVLANPRRDDETVKDHTPGWLAARGVFVDGNDLITK